MTLPITQARIYKALGKKRVAMILDYDYSCGVFDIVIKDGWFYDGDGTIIVLEPFDDENFWDIVKVLKQRFDEFVWTGVGA